MLRDHCWRNGRYSAVKGEERAQVPGSVSPYSYIPDDLGILTGGAGLQAGDTPRLLGCSRLDATGLRELKSS